MICRALGIGESMQSHIFLPHTLPTNERLLCGTSSLIPIDLKPWLEHDPFSKSNSKLNATNVNNVSNDERGTNPPSHPDKIIIKLDFPDTTIHIKHDNDDQLPNAMNRTIINDKIDLDTDTTMMTHKQTNKLKTITTKTMTTSTTTRPKTSTNKKRKLTTALQPQRFTLTKTTKTITQRPKQTKKQNTKNSNRRKHKRDIAEFSANENARSTIYIKFDKQTDEKPSFDSSLNGKKRNDIDKISRIGDKEYVIVTPDQNSYDIEIKIKRKPNQTPNTVNENIYVATTNSNQEPNIDHQDISSSYSSNNNVLTMTSKRPQHFYNVAQPSHSNASAAYNSQFQENKLKPQQMTYTYVTNRLYNGLNMKRTIATPATTKRYSMIQQDDVTPKPYTTTKKPYLAYETNEQNDFKPFYSYPTVQNTDASSYYSTINDNEEEQEQTQNDFISSIEDTHAQQFNTNYLNRPSANSKPIMMIQRPIAQNHKPNNAKPPQNDIQNAYIEPTYFNDFTTKQSTKLTTTFTVQSDNDELINSYHTNDNNFHGSIITNRPNDFVTFYTVMTTRKRKRTKPTKPTATYNQQQNNNDDDEYDNNDDDDDDVEYDENTSNTSYFNPTSMFSNIVNTFNDYFGGTRKPTTTTTTRKPYIQHDDFYTYPSLPLQEDSPYSRQTNIDIKMRSLNRMTRQSEYNAHDYEQSTYSAALNADFNDDITDDDNINKNVQFDRDGYLRPEYMNYEPKVDGKLHFNVGTKVDTKQMLSTRHANRQTHNFQKLYNGNNVDQIYSRQRQNKQITTLTNDKNKKDRPSVRLGALQSDQPIDLIPINVLTKPER